MEFEINLNKKKPKKRYDIELTCTNLYTIIYLKYLIKKYKNVYIFNDIDYFLNWSNNNKILYCHKNLLKKFNKRINDYNERFIIINLRIENLNNYEKHANVLIYDKKRKEMERFEPYGYLENIDNTNLDKIIKKIFKKEIKKYYKPLDFCPFNSFQKLEILEKRKEGDLCGFCNIWVLWYIELRISNPNISRKKIVKFAIKKIGKNFKNFIRDYANFVYEVNNKL